MSLKKNKSDPKKRVNAKLTEESAVKNKDKRVILSVYLTESERERVNAYMDNLRISASAWVRMQFKKEGVL